MSKKNKNIAEQALLEVENLQKTLKESSKSVISSLLSEAAKDVIKQEIAGEDEDDDYEVVDAENSSENKDDKEASEDSVDSAFAEEPEDEDGEAEEGSSEDSEDDGDEWSQFDDYKVGDDEYDLTGVDDDETVVKVYKLLKDTDNVVVKKDGDKVKIQDNETGAEYVIDLDDDAETDSEEKPEDEMSEGCIKEGEGDEPAGFEKENPSQEDLDIDKEYDDYHNPLTRQDPKFENKKSRKTMKESKEVIFEVDLGYTDNYQDKDAIQGLNNNEPSKNDTLDAGVPTGTKKPWAADAKSKGEPYKGGVKTEEVEAEEPVVEEEAELEEGTNVTMPNRRKKVKSHSPQQKENPKVAHHDSKNGEYKAIEESYEKDLKKALKENKELKEAVVKIKGALQEALIVNVNLGQFVKLVTENTTTQEEKVEILNRLNNEAKTIEQSKALYESIKKDLNKDVKPASSINESAMAINESKANEKEIYQSKEMVGMINLMKRMGTL